MDGPGAAASRPLPKVAADAIRPEVTRQAVSEAENTLPAAERLALSRAQLRSAMMDIAHPQARPSVLGESAGDWMHDLLARARALPGASIIVESVESWWREHPLHTAGVMAGEASKAFVRPIAQRSPQTLLLGAAAIGAVLVLSRPWRWLIRPALFVGLVPKLLSLALRRMPLDAWIRMAGATFGKKVAASRNASAKPKPKPKPAAPADANPGRRA